MQKIEDLRKEVSEFTGKSLDELKGLSKTALRDLLKVKAEVTDSPNEDIWEKMADPNWTDEVMEEFEENELSDGYPKVDGLRRVALKILGPFSIEVEPNQISAYPGKGVTTVTVHVVFQRNGLRVGGAADVSIMNAPDENGKENVFMKHPTSTAESKAEGRALRKALFMTKVYTAEEMNKASDQMAGNPIINTIKQVCHKKNFNPIKVASLIKGDVVTLDELTKEEARKVIEKATDLSRLPESEQEAYR